VDVGRAGRGGPTDRGLRGHSLGDAYLSTTDLREFRGRRDRWLALCDAVWETRAFGDFWQHVLVAEGVLDVAVDPVANPWDLAALAPVVAEAGGRLTDLTGVDTWAGGDALTTNGALHDAVRAVIGR
jgi:histidinol-phosphatase